ncbi:MAG: twin-arginine translocase TatA/TatE family subunit [Thermoleophilia bacterium]|nr:twin-arginine translocase TatA/TatE family subunit [Thermoleophilia bacterium]
MGNIGAWEIALIVLVALLIFGPKQLPKIGRSLGRGMREFKETVTDTGREIKEATAVTPSEFKAALNPLAEIEKTPAEEPKAAAAPPPAAPPSPPVEEPAAVVVSEEIVEPEPDRAASS